MGAAGFAAVEVTTTNRWHILHLDPPPASSKSIISTMARLHAQFCRVSPGNVSIFISASRYIFYRMSVLLKIETSQNK